MNNLAGNDLLLTESANSSIFISAPGNGNEVCVSEIVTRHLGIVAAALLEKIERCWARANMGLRSDVAVVRGP
jgi:hypothetical protein